MGAAAELRFFHCGNGDTILIRGGGEWALVDANLTNEHGTRKRLEQVLLEHGRPPLKFVCITHFDKDHIHGMADFLESHYLGRDGRWRIGQVILPINDPSLFVTLIGISEEYGAGNERITRALIALARMLDRYRRAERSERLTYYAPRAYLEDPNKESMQSNIGPWNVWFLGPRKATKQKYVSQWFDELMEPFLPPEIEDEDALENRIGENNLSQIIALSHQDTRETVLLTGDATADELHVAMIELQQLQMDGKLGRLIRVVKASHHGAYTEDASNCHHLPLYQKLCSKDYSHVVITCLGNSKHPHPMVLNDLRKEGLVSTMTGGTHAVPVQVNRGVLAGRPIRPPVSQPDILAELGLSSRRINIRGGQSGDIFLHTLQKNAGKLDWPK